MKYKIADGTEVGVGDRIWWIDLFKEGKISNGLIKSYYDNDLHMAYYEAKAKEEGLSGSSEYMQKHPYPATGIISEPHFDTDGSIAVARLSKSFSTREAAESSLQ